MIEVEACDLLVELFGQHEHRLAVLLGVRVQFELRQYLVGERRRHHEAWMAGRAAEVQQPALREHHHTVAVRKTELVVLRLDFNPLHSREFLQPRHVDLVVEVTDVSDNRFILHPRHCFHCDDVVVAGRGDEDVCRLDDVFERRHLIPFHRRLQGADRVYFGNDDARALAAQRLRAALADFAEAEHDRDLAAEHDVGGSRQTVGQRVAAAVDVVEL